MIWNRPLPSTSTPSPSASIDDLSRVVFEAEYLPNAFAPDVLEENGRSYEERLASCRMITSRTELTPTVVGLLALGKSPQDYLPGAYIQFLRIEGTELADPVVDEAEIQGNVSGMLRHLEEKLRSHNRVNVDVTSNPVTDYRNPNLADVLKIFGFVQSFGRGIAIARRAMENNGNPPLEFEVTPSADADLERVLADHGRWS